MHFQKVIIKNNKKTNFLLVVLKVTETKSRIQRYGSADPDP